MMILEPYKLVTVYEDWENEKKPIGTALLLKKRRNGLPFVLKDMIETRVPKTISIYDEKITNWETVEKPLTNYNLYSYQKWDVLIIKSNNSKYDRNRVYTLNIRFFVKEVNDSELKLHHKEKELTEEEYLLLCKKKNKIIDNFIKVNGIEIF